MTQTLALLIDAYRDLNSKKLFWITINLSWLVVLIFLAIGINHQGLTLFGYHPPIWYGYNSDVVTQAAFYKTAFYSIGVGVWLTVVATVLALVSTSGIFPDLLSGGSVELYISTPMSRLRLFLTKYASGLLFVALQVAVFVVTSFVVLRIRAGEWIPTLFLAIPLVVLFYSYVYCVCVLLGILTKSNISALILTILFWLTIFAVQWFETDQFLTPQLKQQIVVARLDRDIAREEQRAKNHTDAGMARVGPRKSLEELRAERKDNQRQLDTLTNFHNYAYFAETLLPKTSDTVALMRRSLISSEEDKRAAGAVGDPDSTADPVVVNKFGTTNEDLRARNQMLRIVRSRSIAWSIGSSLIFEAVIVSIAAWLFCRRDY